MRGSEFLQSATPAFATIAVSNVLGTSVRIRQLTIEEIRARGIVLDLQLSWGRIWKINLTLP